MIMFDHDRILIVNFLALLLIREVAHEDGWCGLRTLSWNVFSTYILYKNYETEICGMLVLR